MLVLITRSISFAQSVSFGAFEAPASAHGSRLLRTRTTFKGWNDSYEHMTGLLFLTDLKRNETKLLYRALGFESIVGCFLYYLRRGLRQNPSVVHQSMAMGPSRRSCGQESESITNFLMFVLLLWLQYAIASILEVPYTRSAYLLQTSFFSSAAKHPANIEAFLHASPSQCLILMLWHRRNRRNFAIPVIRGILC